MMLCPIYVTEHSGMCVEFAQPHRPKWVGDLGNMQHPFDCRQASIAGNEKETCSPSASYAVQSTLLQTLKAALFVLKPLVVFLIVLMTRFC